MESKCCLCRQLREGCVGFPFMNKDGSIDIRSICPACARRFGWYCKEPHEYPAEMLTFLDGGQKICPICVENRVRTDFEQQSKEIKKVFLEVRSGVEDKDGLTKFLDWIRAVTEKKHSDITCLWIAIEVALARYNSTSEKVIDEIKKSHSIAILLPEDTFSKKS